MKKIIALFAATIISISSYSQWDTLHTGLTTNFKSIFFINETEGVAVGKDPIGSGGQAFLTIDGGLNWDLRVAAAHSYNDVFFSSHDHGWIAADSGYILIGNNGGQGWLSLAHIGNLNFNSIFFTNDSDGYVGGASGVLYRTNNGGAYWDTLNSGTNLSINDIYFTDASNGWIVGDGGYLAATSDSGNTWTQIAQPFFGFMNIQGFAYNSSFMNAVIVGNNGDALFSSNSGMNWTSFSSGVNTTLNKAAYANDLGGVIVGNNGVILRTEDGGTTWMRDNVSGVTQNFTGICWASDTLAYVCGSNGRILKSHYDISSVNSPLVNGITIAAFPNPFAEDLNIAIDLSKNSSIQISVLDLTGRIVLNENEGELNFGKQIIHLAGISSLVSGMYFVKVISGNGEMVIPVEKQ